MSQEWMDHIRSEQTGSGLLSSAKSKQKKANLAKDLVRLAKGKLSMTPMFPGEAHATQINLQNEVKPGGFIGPGTQIEKRLELAQGRTDVLPTNR